MGYQDQYNNPATLDYLNQLKPYTTNPRNQSKEIYKNYRNEGLANYPHMQDYQKTMQQMAEEQKQAQLIPQQYEANKNKLIQDEDAKINQQKVQAKALYKEYHNLLQQQADKNALIEQQRIAAEQYARDQQAIQARNNPVSKPSITIQPVKQQVARRPREQYFIPPDQPVIYRNTQTGNGVMSTFSAPFSQFVNEFGLKHPYMRLENQNHGKWYDYNDQKYYNTQF